MAHLATDPSATGDLMSVLTLLVHQVLAAEQRLGPVVFRDMLGLHFSATRPVDDEPGEHPLAQFVIAAIANAQAAGRVSPGCGRERTRGHLPDRAVRVAGHRRYRVRDRGQRCWIDTCRRSSREWRHHERHRHRGLPQLLGTTRRRRRSAAPPPGQPRGILRSVGGRSRCVRNIPSIERCSCATCAAADPSRVWTSGCCFCWQPPSSTRPSGSVSIWAIPTDASAVTDEPPERVYLALEEHYHTRLLAYVLDIFGLPFQVVVPPFVMRQFVKMEVFLPERLGIRIRGRGGNGRLHHVRRTAPGGRGIVRRRTRRRRTDRKALQRDPHRRGGPCRVLRGALQQRGAGDDALALPAFRTAVCSPDRGDQPADRSRGSCTPVSTNPSTSTS